MSNICGRIVEALGDWWSYLGWALVICALLAPFITPESDALMVFVVAGLLAAVWWIIDAVNQEVPLWMWLLGILMIGMGILPWGFRLTVACWVIYWFKVRE